MLFNDTFRSLSAYSKSMSNQVRVFFRGVLDLQPSIFKPAHGGGHIPWWNVLLTPFFSHLEQFILGLFPLFEYCYVCYINSGIVPKRKNDKAVIIFFQVSMSPMLFYPEFSCPEFCCFSFGFVTRHVMFYPGRFEAGASCRNKKSREQNTRVILFISSYSFSERVICKQRRRMQT